MNIKKLLFIFSHSSKRIYIYVLLLMIFSAFLDAIGVGIVLPFIMVIINPSSIKLPFSIPAFLHLSHSSFIFVLVLVAFIVKNVLSLLVGWIKTYYIFDIRKALSLRLFSAYLSMPYDLYIQKNRSDLTYFCTHQIHNFIDQIVQPLFLVLSECFVLACISVLLLFYDPIAIISSFVMMCLIGLSFGAYSKHRLKACSQVQYNAAVTIQKIATECLSSLKDVQLFQSGQYFFQKFHSERNRLEKHTVYGQVLQLAPRSLFEIGLVMSLMGLCFYKVWNQTNLMSLIPTLALFTAAAFRIFPSFMRISSAIATLRNSESTLLGIHCELSECESYIKAAPTLHLQPIHFRNELCFNQVSYTYPNQAKPAVSQVSLCIPRGTSFAFIGPSGSGKTTLIDLLLGVLTPQTGSVQLDGHPIFEVNRRTVFGYVPQAINILDESLRNNVAFGVDPLEIDDEQVWKSLELAELDDFFQHTPKGLDTVLGDRGVLLSGGQRQRIGIARALYHNPQILVLDEATSALDIETESHITQNLAQLALNRTVIVIAHRLSTVMNCTAIALVQNGRIADLGTYSELVNRNEWLQRIDQHYRTGSGVSEEPL